MERKGQVALLDGPGASGKTVLLHLAAEQAAEAGLLVLRAACAPAERALPFGVLSQLFHSTVLPEEAARRAAELLESAVEAAPGTESGPARPGLVQVFQRLCLLLLELAAGQPVMIAIDDVQHADAASLYWLLHLVRRLGSSAILLALTDNADLPTQAPSFRAELRRQPYLHQLRLAPLSPAGVTELAAQSLGRETAVRLGPEFYATSGGNLPLLHALIEDHQLSGAIRPQGYGLTLVGQLECGEADALAVARSLAVLGPEATVEEVGQLAGTGAEKAVLALNSLTASGVLDNGAFRHPVGPVALVDNLPRQQRSDLHLSAARMLHTGGGAAVRVARHLVEADQAPDPWALQALREAAEHELLAERHLAASACLELAHRCCPPGEDRSAVQARLLQVEWRSNPAAADRHLAALTAAIGAGHLDHRDRGALVRQLLWHGRAKDARNVLERMRSAVKDPHSEAGAELRDVELWVAWTHPPLASNRRLRVTAEQGAGVTAPESGPWLQSMALLADALVRGRAHEVADRAERVLGDLATFRTTFWAEEAALVALSVLTAIGRLDEADAWCDRVLTEAPPRRPPTLRALLSAAKADVALHKGELTSAIEHAEVALTHITPRSWGVAVGLPLGTMILACTRTGRLDEASRRLAQSVPESMFQSRYGLHYLFARGHYYLATNHCHAALADFLSGGELMQAWGLDVPGLAPWRTGAAEAWLRLGNPDQARKLIHDQLARPGATGPHTRGLSLRLLAEAGPAARRPQLLAEALELFEECGDRYEQARVLADTSQAHYVLGDSRRARMLSRRARHMANQCDAVPLSQELLSASAELQSGPAVEESDETAALTESERRVASLAVRGYTNREIAAKLYVTPSTVEQHLTRVYRKQGVKHRRDLPVSLGASTDRPAGRGAQQRLAAS